MLTDSRITGELRHSAESELTPLVRAGLAQAAERSVSLGEYRVLVERADQIRAKLAAFMQTFPILVLPGRQRACFRALRGRV